MIYPLIFLLKFEHRGWFQKENKTETEYGGVKELGDEAETSSPWIFMDLSQKFPLGTQKSPLPREQQVPNVVARVSHSSAIQECTACLAVFSSKSNCRRIWHFAVCQGSPILTLSWTPEEELIAGN